MNFPYVMLSWGPQTKIHGNKFCLTVNLEKNDTFEIDNNASSISKDVLLFFKAKRSEPIIDKNAI